MSDEAEIKMKDEHQQSEKVKEEQSAETHNETESVGKEIPTDKPSSPPSTPPTATETEIEEKAVENEIEKSAETKSSGTAGCLTAEGQDAAVSQQQEAFAGYEEHVSYASDGGAIYTDPATKQKFKWCNEENKWQPLTDVEAASAGNLFENEHYKWCQKTQQWLPKQTTETEHYKWDEEQKKWLPKQQTASGEDVVYGVDENGDRTYTDKDGAVFFWDAERSAWIPKIDDDFMARYQMNYGFIDNTKEEADREAAEAKRKEEELKQMTAEAEAAMNAAAESADGVPANVKRKLQEPPKWFDMDPSQNTKVYVSNMPVDITLEEFGELMSKCGLIMQDPQTKKFKLKLYKEKNGQIKGDGLCDYIKVESVKLALEILDEYVLRGHKIRVQRAEFQMRGEYNPSLKPKRRKQDKEKVQKLKEKLLDWRPDKMRGERSKHEKTVIIKNLFTPDLFEKEVELILEYQNNLREECAKCGLVRKVVLYDRHPEGVAQINMSSPEEADQVIQMMQGRYFGQRQLTAEHWDGRTKYKVDESAAEAEQRLSKWDEYLAAEEANKKVEDHEKETTAETA